jgi:hypothetical protein
LEGLIDWKDGTTDPDGNQTMGTLDEHGDYTCASDVFQVGVMMLERMRLNSEEAKAFAHGLMSKQWTVKEALQQTFMQEQSTHSGV